MGTCKAHHRDDASPFAANGTFKPSRIETKHIEHVPEVDADCFHINRSLIKGQRPRWHLLRANPEIGNRANLGELHLKDSCVV